MIFTLGMHVFWTWAPFFWTCTCFLDLTRFFFGPKVTKNVGDLLVCFLDPVGIFFLDLQVFVLDPGNFFSTAKLIVSELGFCFLDPCTCFVDLASIGWGGAPLLLALGWMFWTLAPSFLEPVYFLDLAQGGGNLDTETRSCSCRGSSGIETMKT